MKLGERVQISIGVPNLADAVAFYTTLGFTVLAEATQPWPWAQFTDGQNLVLLNQDGNRYVGLLYFSDDAAARVAALEAQGVTFLARQSDGDQLQTAIFADPDGHRIGIVNQDPAGMPLRAGTPSTKCGKFGEFALAVDDFHAAAAFWGQLGFDQVHASTESDPWGIFSDGMIMVGIHQTKDFAGPCMTYFAADMPRRVEELAQSGIQVENGVLTTSWGQTIFLFEGEI